MRKSIQNSWAKPMWNPEMDWADFDLRRFNFVIVLPRRISHVGYDLARLDGQWRYWMVIDVMTIQYRHRRLWRFYQKRRYSSFATPSFRRSQNHHRIAIKRLLWRFCEENRGSYIARLLVVVEDSNCLQKVNSNSSWCINDKDWTRVHSSLEVFSLR